MKKGSSRRLMKTVRNKTAFEAALHLIAYRAQSEWEIRTKLRHKGYREEEIGSAVERLYRSGYLNDEELAAEIFESYRADGLYGDRYIHQKLKMRGLACACHLTAEEELHKARAAFARKSAVMPGLAADYKKAAGFLMRRGFSASAAAAVWEDMGHASTDGTE